MKALIIGATGATGKDLLEVLLKDEKYTEVVIFVRRSIEIKHPGLKEIITDLNNLESVTREINGDIWFSCLGTTLKAAGSKENQWEIDYGIPSKFAQIAKANGVKSAVLLSAYGANSGSSVFYSKMKGQLEQHIEGLGFEQYIIFRPGLLLRRDTIRFGEKASGFILNFLNSLGILRKFKPLPTKLLAEKLARAPMRLDTGKHLIELDAIFSF